MEADDKGLAKIQGSVRATYVRRQAVNSSLHQAVRFATRFTANSRLSQSLLRTLPVPGDLASVTDVDQRGEVAAATVGLATQDVESIWSAVEDLYCTGYYPAITLCIRRHGQVFINRAIGYARGFGEKDGPELPEPMTTHTPICLYSASKAVTAILIHKLADDGHINLLDPVAHYIPEFAQHGKDRLNILQILSHRGGVPGIETHQDIASLVDHQSLLKLICASAPIDVHGRAQAYHAVTGGTILREVLERVTGQDIAAYWQDHFKKPMGFRYLGYGASRRDFAVMARDHFCGAKLPQGLRDYFKTYLGLDVETDRDFVNGYTFFSKPIPAGNMIATAEEISRFFQMLLDGGRYGQRQLLSPLAVHRATWESSPHRLDNVLKVPLRYSAGMMLGGEPFGLFGPHTGNAFGHNGMINILVWADPDRDISAALLNTGKPLLAANVLQLVQLLRRINNRIPRKS